MSDARTIKARCRCGEVLTITGGTNGFKAVCPECRAVVRARPPRRPTSATHRKGSVAVTCICGHMFVTSPDRIGHHVRCPQCEDRFRVPPPGERLLDMYHTEVIPVTDEIPVVPDSPSATPSEPPGPSPKQPRAKPD